ncbi:Hsp33 family molecular chaperone HslO [Aerococcus sanguinicola]|uniref:Hsp33 family molecular chaperone HslO n=1 Tax=unclassified Aerococcus TaxID=2618060 RepID=UPI0008A1AB41|nr:MULTISPECIES: Hsp33 family molecular chaperone HslO [unclassified Aerococcus]KAB0646390.1 Hsp33 family molecular chaperone HslO [Aerococcus sanguinicola]MDK6233714.1 Hsp33 family molecular chaperone HslO [Aerococcus sp. UMB10185]MDK6805591.1 Hsp33 family molecular chaperone HslO [Aerococcus sp. UMB7834]MDK6855931.1 Hsp33 family molecular chaperone HslO [Aerococcus sp. UMB7533]MDK8502850.1 Hsp33 family molecular chaperone HslO [Aerococcus sp. UMB1112A]
MTDQLVKATAFDGQIRVRAVDASQVVASAQEKHDSWSASSAALGRTLAGTLLLAADIKDDAKMTVQIAGNGPAGKIVVSADGQGHVKGYIDQPHVSLDSNAQGKIDVRGAVGTEGTFSVIKDLGLKEPFQGQVPLVSGEIAEDFTYYLTVSEQVPSAVGLGVLVNPDESIACAGGWVIQVLPGCSEEVIDQLEASIADMPQVTDLLSQGLTPEEMIYRLLGQDQVKILSQEEVSFKCDCSKERFAQGLAAIGSQELETIIEEDGGAETVCHFCNKTYQFTAEELREIAAQASA